MDLADLQPIASDFLESESRLLQIEVELQHVERELREQPRRDKRDEKFSKLIGLEWKAPSDLMRKRSELISKKEVLTKLVRETMEKLIEEFSSPEFTMPLDRQPSRDGEFLVFSYRGGASYPRAWEAFGNLLGLEVPLMLDPVTIGADGIRVKEDDEYLAKEMIVDTIMKLQKTLEMKIEKQPSRR